MDEDEMTQDHPSSEEHEEAGEINQAQEGTNDGGLNEDTASDLGREPADSHILLKFVGALVVILIGLSAYATLTNSTGFLRSLNFSQQNLVAVVNGEGIPQQDFTMTLEQNKGWFKEQGFETSGTSTSPELQEQIVSFLVNETLVRQKAEESGITVTGSDIDDAYEQYVDYLGGEKAMEEYLSSAGISEGRFREEVREEILVNRYISQNFSINVTESEMRNYYEQVLGGSQNAQSYADVRTRVRDSLIRKKRIEAINALAKDIRKDADVEILMK